MNPGRTSTVGPYRLGDRLGAGGMGEVWRAWDERLDRSVAVKLIRPESAGDQTARERFRREARAAAALTHPSIVRIYDIVESGEGDAIVMELVEGALLSQRIAGGPLPIEEAVRLGRQIAEGLAAAHRRGILHRDLKAENVIVTPEGEAKILDFGLAKRLEGETEASLTRSDGVIGTFRAMSPEQARGLALDSRSDLFSFGVLLYEMLTGVSPFKAASAPDTLIRICTWKQAPVRELRPEVPEELSSLIDHLLEKDSAFRPRGAGEVVHLLRSLRAGAPPGGGEEATREGPTILTDVLAPDPSALTGPIRRWSLPALVAGSVLAVVLAVFGWSSLHREPALYVAVPVPLVESERDDPRIALTESALRASVLNALLSFEETFPVAPDQADAVAGSSLSQMARTLGAGEVIRSRLRCRAEVCSIVLDRIHGVDGALLWTATFEAPIEKPELLADAVRGQLMQTYGERRVRRGAPQLQVRPRDYAEYLKLVRSFETSDEAERSVDEILSRLEAIRSGSPRFLEAYTFEAEVLEYRFRTRREPADVERAFRILGDARELAPDDPRPVRTQISLALVSGQLDRAETALQDLERLSPGDARILAQRARLLDRRGQTEEAVRLMEKAALQLPFWKHLFWAADMSYRLGRTAEARRLLEEVLKRSPGHYLSQSKLAEIELMNGSPERAAQLYSDLVERSPEYAELTNLGLALFLLGRYGEAEERYRQALALAPVGSLALLNLADATLARGNTVEAGRLYREVLRASEKDPASSSNIQILSARAQALAHLGRSGEALREIQAALRLAPENPQTAYEAAVVYAVLEDRASALYHAQRALAGGFDPRWLTIPWFSRLRPVPEFRRLLERPSTPVPPR